MNIEKVEQILNTIKFLSKEEADLLLYKLNSNKDELIKSILFNNEVNCCINCGSINSHKRVKRNNKQRYKCYDCKKTFTSTSNTIFYGFHKSYINKFKKFIECAINNLSLKRTAEICEISVSCAFNWRHKLISSLTNKQKDNEITGLIEIDEIYFRNSNKGNFKSGIGRKVRTHGYCPNLEDSVGLFKSKICITTAIDRTKNICFILLVLENRMLIHYINVIKVKQKHQITLKSLLMEIEYILVFLKKLVVNIKCYLNIIQIIIN